MGFSGVELVIDVRVMFVEYLEVIEEGGGLWEVVADERLS